MLPAIQLSDLTFESHKLRVVWKSGNPWWVLADVCEVLEIANPRDVAARLDNDEKNSVAIADGNRGNPNMTIVSEGGLYLVLRSSRKPVAKRLDRWVRHEVLPEIRRTGSYGGPSAIMQQLNTLFDQGVALQRCLQVVDRKLDENSKNVIYLKDRLDSVQGDLHSLSERVNDIVPRRHFSKNSLRQFAHVIATFYDGMCALCRKTRIIDDRGISISRVAHADHFIGREKNQIEDGWLVCDKCNYQLARDSTFKERAKPHFRVFQDYRAELFGTRSSQSLRKRLKSNSKPKSKSKRCGSTPDMFR